MSLLHVFRRRESPIRNTIIRELIAARGRMTADDLARKVYGNNRQDHRLKLLSTVRIMARIAPGRIEIQHTDLGLVVEADLSQEHAA